MEKQKPQSWEEFVGVVVEVFAAKNADYDSRFMKALRSDKYDSRTLWAWEVEKKLDRLRTWIRRGNLQVKGEGVLDSVIDLVNYTVQYDLSGKRDPFAYLDPPRYRGYLEYLGAPYLMRYLVDESYIGVQLLDITDDLDKAVIGLLYDYMGGTE